MGGGCTGAPAEGGKEGDEGLGGSKDEAPDTASRRLPPQPEGLMAKGSHAASAVLARASGPRGLAPAIGCADAALFAARMVNGEPAPPCAHFLAWKPFAINAAPIDYLESLLSLPSKDKQGSVIAVLGIEGRHVMEDGFAGSAGAAGAPEAAQLGAKTRQSIEFAIPVHGLR